MSCMKVWSSFSLVAHNPDLHPKISSSISTTAEMPLSKAEAAPLAGFPEGYHPVEKAHDGTIFGLFPHSWFVSRSWPFLCGLCMFYCMCIPPGFQVSSYSPKTPIQFDLWRILCHLSKTISILCLSRVSNINNKKDTIVFEDEPSCTPDFHIKMI